MKKVLPASWFFLRRHLALAALIMSCVPSVLKAEHRSGPPLNKYGAPVLDAHGHHINYDRKTIEAMARSKGAAAHGPAKPARTHTPTTTPTPRPPPTPPPRPTPRPTRSWGYAVFGSGIGLSNIVIGPTPQSGTPEIIIGGNSRRSDVFAPNDFWQSIRYNPATGTYDTVFVSPIYQPREFYAPVVNISRIGLGHVTSVSDLQIVVMLEDGRIYLYDFVTKAQVGYLDINPFPANFELKGLSLTDLDGDGLAELIVTNPDDLYVFDGYGRLLWQVSGAGGLDVVVGRMDNGASLKIAATNGKVVDAVTHGVVWNYTNGFGFSLRLAPFPGENYQQLIAAEAWYFVYAYDVGRQLPRWSIQTFDNDALAIADVDSDGVPEVILGDGQWGALHVYDLNTRALKWEVNNPRHGITNIAVGDVDNDGVAELLWGAGWSDTGPDHLYVASTTGAHDIKWQSIDLVGPFLGPVIGDLDGDGQPELVICSRSSDAEYAGGRILVFSLSTLSLRAISDPVLPFLGSVHDLKLRDVERNGRMQIVIAADYGTIKIYRFDLNDTFTQIWTAAALPLSGFSFADVVDLDNNGTLKIVGATYSPGYIYAFDYPSGAQSWQSVNLGYNDVTGLIVEDLDDDGSKEIAALVTNGDLYTWDGPTRQLRDLRQGTRGTLLSNRTSPAGLVLGDTSGVGHFLRWGNNGYTETFTRQLATACDPYGLTPCPSGLNVTSDDSLWTGFGGILSQRPAPSYDSVVWRSPEVGDRFGRFVATMVRDGKNCVFSSAQHAAVGFGNCAPTPTPSPTPTPNPRATPRPRPTPPPRP